MCIYIYIYEDFLDFETSVILNSLCFVLWFAQKVTASHNFSQKYSAACLCH